MAAKSRIAKELIWDNERTEPYTVESLYALPGGTQFVSFFTGKTARDNFTVTFTKQGNGPGCGYSVVQNHRGHKVSLNPPVRNVVAMVNSAVLRLDGYRLARWA